MFYLMEYSGKHGVSLHHEYMLKCRKFPCFKLNCKITSGTLESKKFYERKNS